MSNEIVTLFNRTDKVLTGTWDGREHAIQPGKNQVPRAMAEKFVSQNPRMGSRDPYTGYTDFLCGIVEDNMDCTPCEQDPSAVTLDDIREKLKTGEYQIVKGNGVFNPIMDASKPLPPFVPQN